MGILAWLMGEEPDPITQIVNYENKGQFGEYLTNFALSKVKDYNQILNNVYIPIGNGKTTEIDSIMVHKKGIFVFESKNYGGWIFGGIDQKNWTQCFPNREKYKFYNPIMQNRTHINALARVTGISKNKFFSFIRVLFFFFKSANIEACSFLLDIKIAFEAFIEFEDNSRSISASLGFTSSKSRFLFSASCIALFLFNSYSCKI